MFHLHTAQAIVVVPTLVWFEKSTTLAAIVTLV